MNTLLLRGRVFTPTEEIGDGAVLIEAGRIVAVGPAATVAPPDTAVLDLGERIIAPGFIDLQLNGAFGHDFTADPASVGAVAARLPETGVTAFLPTIITSPRAAYPDIMRVGGVASSSARGARPLGLHLEGPFLSPAKPGAHNPAHLRRPTADDLDWIAASGQVRLLTLAPEIPGALDLIAPLRDRGIVVSAGHSAASYAEAEAGFRAGITCGTHLFNAMPPLHHREPGLVGALLANRAVRVGLIPDGIHLHPTLIALVQRLKGADGVTLVTDAMAAAGMSPGHYRLADRDVIVDDRSARLADGTLAGSILTLDQALRNYLAFTDCGPAEAIQAVTLTPALVLGLDAEIGRIAPGCRADLVVLDTNMEVEQTVIGGEVVYRAGTRAALTTCGSPEAG